MENDDISQEIIRTPKFTEYEQELLQRLVTKYKAVIMSTKTGKFLPKFKEETWRKLEADFNNDPQVFTRRTVTQLKNKWDYMKRSARKEVTEYKKVMKGTGGGPPPPPLTETTKFLMDTIPESVVGSQTEFDSDNTYNQPLIVIQAFEDQQCDIEIPVTKLTTDADVMKDAENAAADVMKDAEKAYKEKECNTPKLMRMTRKKQLEQERAQVKDVISITTPQYTRTKFCELAEKKIDLAEENLDRKRKLSKIAIEQADMETVLLRKKICIADAELKYLDLKCKVEAEELEIKKIIKHKMELEIRVLEKQLNN